MVGVDLDIAVGLVAQIEEPVASEGVEHVVEKRHRRRALAAAAAVERELELDLGFAGLASLPGAPVGHEPGSLAHELAHPLLGRCDLGGTLGADQLDRRALLVTRLGVDGVDLEHSTAVDRESNLDGRLGRAAEAAAPRGPGRRVGRSR